MAVLDGSIANVALPTLSHELRVDAAASIWVVNAYQLAVAVLLLPFSSLGDVVGYRKVYASGIAIFTLGSLACALSPTLTTLIAARVLQGVGGAAIMSIAPALSRSIFPAKQLGVAVGISALTVAASALSNGYGKLEPIDMPPYYGYPSKSVIVATYCGVSVDAGMRVRDVWGKPIPNLYAAGEIVGGLHGNAYMTGSSLGKASIFGRLAAKSILDDAKPAESAQS